MSLPANNPALPMGLNLTTDNQVLVTVAAGADKRLTKQVGAFTYVFVVGDTLMVSKFEEAILRRDGVII